MHLPPSPPNRSHLLPPSLHKQHSYSLFPTSMTHHWHCETRFVSPAHVLRRYISAFALHRNRQQLHCRAHACTLGAGRLFCTVSYTENEKDDEQHPGTKTTINPAEDNCKKQCGPTETKSNATTVNFKDKMILHTAKRSSPLVRVVSVL